MTQRSRLTTSTSARFLRVLLFWRSQISTAKTAEATPALPKIKLARSSAPGSCLLKVWALTSSANVFPIVFLSQIQIPASSWEFLSAVLLIFLFLAEPPCILEKPESMNVLPGSKVYFNVLLAGTPPLTIKWFKNQKEIVSSADCLVIKDNTSTSLALFFAKSSDSADYVCEIQNDVGSTSCQATLFVKGWLPHHLKLHLFKFHANPPALHDLGIINPEHEDIQGLNCQKKSNLTL